MPGVQLGGGAVNDGNVYGGAADGVSEVQVCAGCGATFGFSFFRFFKVVVAFAPGLVEKLGSVPDPVLETGIKKLK